MPPLTTQLTTHPLYYFTVGLELTTKLTTILLYLTGLRGGRVPLATKLTAILLTAILLTTILLTTILLTTILLTTTLLYCQVYVEGEFLLLHILPYY